MEENETHSERADTPDNVFVVAWRRVRRFRLLVLFAVALGSGLGLFYSLIVPNQFQSVGKLYVRPGIRDLITPEAAFSSARGSTPRSAGGREAVLNELQVLSGPQLYDKVVKSVGVDILLAPYDPGIGPERSSWTAELIHDFQVWWFAPESGREEAPLVSREKVASMLLAKGVSIVAESGTSVIACSYAAYSPETARLIVNAVLEAAREVHNDVFDTMSSLGAIEDEMVKAEEAARKAEESLREFRVKNDIHAFESEYAAVLAYLNSLDQQADDTDLQIGRKKAEREVVVSLEQIRLKDRTMQGAASFALNPDYTALTSFLTQLELRELVLQESKGTLSTAEYKRRKTMLEKAIDETRARILEEGKQLQIEGARPENPLYVRIAQSLDDIQVALKSLEVMKTKIESLRTQSRDRLLKFDELSPRLRALELDAQQKRTSADGLIENVTRMKGVQRLERLNSSSVQIMHGGTFEPQKIAPRRGRMVFFGAFGGAVLGLALGLLLALRDTKVRSPEDLASLGIPPESVLPRALGVARRSAVPGRLPAAFAEVDQDVRRFWASIPYERGATEGIKIAFVPCDPRADAGRVGATFALGFAAHAGERVAYVSCSGGESWLARRLEIDASIGWSDVLDGDKKLDQALISTSVRGLAYLPLGSKADAGPHPVTGSGFDSLLAELAANHRFVIVELPGLAAVPESRVALSVVDAVELVARPGGSEKLAVSEAVAAVQVSGARLLGCVLQRNA